MPKSMKGGTVAEFRVSVTGYMYLSLSLYMYIYVYVYIYIYPLTLTRNSATVPTFMLLGIHCLRFVVGFFDALRLVCFVFFVAFSSTLGSILVAFGLLFGTFLSTLGVPGQSRGAFGHPWAPKAQKVRKRSQKAAKN